jgi:hypothetical protein
LSKKIPCPSASGHAKPLRHEINLHVPPHRHPKSRRRRRCRRRGRQAFARSPARKTAAPAKLKGNINHSACRWCYSKIQLEDLCQASKEMGLVALDLLDPNEFETGAQETRPHRFDGELSEH